MKTELVGSFCSTMKTTLTPNSILFCKSLPSGLVTLGLLIAASAPAATYYWDADGDTTVGTGGTGIWDNTSLLWRTNASTGNIFAWPNTSPNADVAQLAGTAGTVTLNANFTDLNVNNITFGAAGYTIVGPSSGTTKLVLSGTTPTIAVGSFGGTILANMVGGSLKKTGAGTLILGGNNTFGSGTMTFGSAGANNGYIRLTSNTACGNYSAINLQSGATVINGLEVAGGVTCGYNVNTGGRGNVTTTGYALRSMSGNNVWNGNITATAAGGSYGVVCDADTLTVNGNISSTVVSTGTRSFDLVGAGSIALNGVISDFNAGANQIVGIIYRGPSALTLSGANTYSGGTTLNGGQLNINNGGTSSANSAIGIGALTINGGTIDNTSSGDLTLAANNPENWNGSFTYAGSVHDLNLGNGVVTLNGTPTITVNSRALTVGGAMGGGSGITKAGAGTLVLSGVSTYSGATTVESGELLMVVGGSSANSAVLLAATPGNAAKLRVSITDNMKEWSCSSLDVNNGGTSSDLEFDFGTVAPSSSVAPIKVNGQLTLSTTPTVTVSLAAVNVTSGGRYPLIAWSGSSVTAPASVSVVASGRSTIKAHLEASGSGPYTLDLVIDSAVSSEPLSWTGGNGTWDVDNSGNLMWKDNTSALTHFMNGDSVVFDNVVGTGGTVSLNSIVSPASVLVNNSSAYVIM